MALYRGRIRGTINDVIEFDVEDGEDPEEVGRYAWQYVEFEDLEIEDVELVDRGES